MATPLAATLAGPAAAADAPADAPVALIKPVYAAAYVGGQANLPSSVQVKTASGATREAAVSWDTSDLTFDQHYRSFPVTGSVENGALTTTAWVETVPESVQYFIDSGMAGRTSPAFEGVRSLVGSALKNEAADKASTAGSWGYVTSNGGFDGTVAPGTATDKNTNGIYGRNAPSTAWLQYTLPNVAAGTYTLTTGHQEWWSGPRTVNVSVTNSSATTSTIASGVTVGSNTSLYSRTRMASGTFTQTTDGPVTVNVSRSAGTEGPAIGWLALAAGSIPVDTTQLVVAAPTATPAAGQYKTAQTVTLSSSTAGAAIYYTTDGSEPSKAEGTRYEGPFQVPVSTTVKAIAIKNGVLSSVTTVPLQIEPVPVDGYDTVPVGRTWYDTAGNPIQAHGGGFLQKDGWYYWVGENKSHDSAHLLGVSLYRSNDLTNWEYVKDIFTPASMPASDCGPGVGCKIERPKLLFNEQTQTFVLWGHWETADSYAASQLIVATSPTVDGDYTFIKHFRPGVGQVSTHEADPTYTGTDGKWGYGSRDMTVYVDPDTDKGYLVSSEDHLSMRLYPLTADYADVDWENSYPLFEGQRREAPAIVKVGDYYYAFTSSQSGWYPNQTMYSYTKDIADPAGWSALAPVGNNTTFYSQPTNIMTIDREDGGREYVYMGDRWNSKKLGASTYVWLPLSFGDTPTDVELDFRPQWSLGSDGSITWPGEELVSQGKPVAATSSTSGHPASHANDGNLFNLSTTGDNTHYYQPTTVPFTWTVDLESTEDLSRIDLSFRSYNGSETYNTYTVSGSNDGQTWTRLVSELANRTVGFKSNPLSGEYRYVRVDVTNVVNDHNGSSAAWAAGLVEVQVYADGPDAQRISFTQPEDVTFGAAPFNLDAEASSGLPVSFEAAGACTVDGTTVTVTKAGTCTVTAQQAGSDEFLAASPVERTFVVRPYELRGFFDPINMDTVNTAKGGSTIPLAFEVLRDGVELTNTAEITSIKFVRIPGDSSVIGDEVEALATGGTSLRYDTTTGRFIYNWKTPKATGDHQLTVTTADGSTISAVLRLR